MLLRPWIILAALALARIAFGYQFQTVATVATDLVGRFNLSYAQLGGLIGAYNLLGVLVALPLGLLARRFGDRWVLDVGLALMTIGACYSVWMSTAFGISAGRAVAGLGAVAVSVLQGKVIPTCCRPAVHDCPQCPHLRLPIGLGLSQLVLPPVLEGFGLTAALLTDVLPAGLALVLFAEVTRCLPPRSRCPATSRCRVGENPCCC